MAQSQAQGGAPSPPHGHAHGPLARGWAPAVPLLPVLAT